MKKHILNTNIMKKEYNKPQTRLVAVRTTSLLVGSGSNTDLNYGGTGSGPVEAPIWSSDNEE